MRATQMALVSAVLCGVVGVAITIKECFLQPITSEYRSFETHPVEQVFRDHKGYRVFFTNLNNVVQEKEYHDNGDTYYYLNIIKRPENIPHDIREKFSFLEEQTGKEVVVIKDLENKEGFANILNYSVSTGYGKNMGKAYVEIHLPKNKEFSPGYDVFLEGKFLRETPMQEVR